MKDKKTSKQRIIEMRLAELKKLSTIKGGLYEKAFWVPKKTVK